MEPQHLVLTLELLDETPVSVLSHDTITVFSIGRNEISTASLITF